MESIEEKTDSDITEVAASKAAFGIVEEAIGPIAALFSVLTAERLMGVFDGAPKKAPLSAEKMGGKSEKQLTAWRGQVRAFEAASAFGLSLEGAFGDPLKIAIGEIQIAPIELVQQLALLPADQSDPQSSLFPKIAVDDRRRLLADRLIAAARARAVEDRFFHWEIGFPNVWSNLLSNEHKGGFDAVIGNPPYVRQELLGDEVKRALRSDYSTFDGVADLYVYFYEQGLRLLRAGGRLSYVVTNKWLKAGYAEALRDLFATKAQIEFVADFGHAKHFFPDADVFPSVIVLRKPGHTEHPSTGDAQVCVIPRDAVPEKGLSSAVAEATYPLPRTHFTKDGWALEPPEVIALLKKIERNSVPLVDFDGIKPLYGIKTGLNEAFLVDTPTRDQLMRDDPGCVDIIKRYIRGQDIERWCAPWRGSWMIFARRGIDIDRYPSVKRHLEKFRTQLEPRPEDWRSDVEWPGRKPGSYAWYEIQDSVDYWEALEQPKILYGDIAWSASFAIDATGLFCNNTGYFIPTGNPHIVGALNAPVGWWFAWRRAQHGKDEALRYFNTFMERYPLPPVSDERIAPLVADVMRSTAELSAMITALHDWLHHEFGTDRAGRALADPHRLDPDGFVSAVRSILPKSRKWSAAEIARLKHEHSNTMVPAVAAAAEVLTLERRLSDLVNAAYGLTPAEVALMWHTAPPRMPLDAAEEIRRLP
jgi:hypothetical protein